MFKQLLAVGVGDDDRRAGRQGREEPLRLLAKAGQIAGPQGPRDGKPLQPGDRRLQLALDDERHAARDLERALGAAGAVVAIVQIRVGRREGDDRQHADDDEQRQPLAKRQAPERPKAAAATARDADRTAHGGDMDLNSSLPERSGVTELHLCPLPRCSRVRRNRKT